MKRLFACVALASLALAPAANASPFTDCLNLGKQVSTALVSAQPGAATDAARQEAVAGRSYCLTNQYSQGIAHYSRALQLLGKG